jgi:hypothetical protein
VNTGNPISPPGIEPGGLERHAANADEIFVIERQRK